MTPKEKSKELFDKFLLEVGTNCEHDSYCNDKKCQYNKRTVCVVDLQTAKQCALIAVDEIISLNIKYNQREIENNISNIKFWLDVKQEIENYDNPAN